MSRKYPSRPIPGVAAVIIHENHVLLCERAKPPSKGRWGIPGGAVEVGETLNEAVIREVKEETDVIVKPIRLLTFFDTIRKDEENQVVFHYILFEYLCDYISGDVRPSSDAPNAKWVPLNDLTQVNIMSSTKRFIEKIVEGKYNKNPPILSDQKFK